MNLQEMMLKKIAQYGGMEKLDKELRHYMKFLKGMELHYIENALLYLRSAETDHKNVAADTLRNRSLTIDYLHTLYDLHEHCNAPAFKLLIEITEFCIENAEKELTWSPRNRYPFHLHKIHSQF